MRVQLQAQAQGAVASAGLLRHGLGLGLGLLRPSLLTTLQRRARAATLVAGAGASASASTGPNFGPEGLQSLRKEDDLANLLKREGPPVVLHCGVDWLERSRQVASRLAEWAMAGGKDAGVVCASADLQAAQDLIQKRGIKSLPAVLLWRAGKVEMRVDGADVAALERILEEASLFRQGTFSGAEDAKILTPRQKMAQAEELERQRKPPSIVASWYRQVVEDDSVQAAPLAFRARLGVLRCALAEAPSEPPREAAEVLEVLHARHEEELQAVAGDAEQLLEFMAHAALLVDHGALLDTDAATASRCEEEVKVLKLYAAGQYKEAVETALAWYRQTACSDIKGLVASYCLPERRVPDRQGGVPSKSIFKHEPLDMDLDKAPGPAAPRAMLRRLFQALGHNDEVVADARAELEFLLDRKPFVPFHTRRLFVRMGGPPTFGRGTGKRSGYSKRYWIFWGPERAIINNRKMGSPHCDKND